jgi:hypothetical protein
MNPWDTGLGAATLLEMHNRFEGTDNGKSKGFEEFSNRK